jgi:predicted metal-dependent hydrolase
MNTKSTDPLRYIAGYAPEIKAQVQAMIDNDSLAKYLAKKYPEQHSIGSDKALRDYVMELKNQYMKKSSPLSKVTFDNKIHAAHNALGLHSYVSRVQGGKIKSNNEIRIGAVFKKAPAAFLQMIVVHELAHLKEKDHDKAFYQLCQHMLPEYHQFEFDMRVYLVQQELIGRDS